MSDEIVLEAEAIGKRYPRGSAAAVHAVADVSLTLHRGEILLITGPNGSGKTTLLSIMGCMLRPSSGMLRILGTDIDGMTERERAVFRRHAVGFLFQTPRFIERLTVRANVEVPMELHGLHRSLRVKRAEELLDMVGMRHRGDFRPAALSGGEQQRVAIARALANNPSIILADEPTGNLDSRTGRETLQLLRELTRSAEASVIITSHDARVVPIADRCFSMEDGRLQPQ